MVVTFVGISGSGKSKLAAQFESQGFIRICPDNIRKELTGDISNQTQNNRVFELAYQRLDEAVTSGKNTVFDVTNLKSRSLRDVAKKIHPENLIIYVMEDSTNVECCKYRISRDLQKGIDRAKTADDVILQRQYNQFMNMRTILLENREFDDVATIISYGGSFA